MEEKNIHINYCDLLKGLALLEEKEKKERLLHHKMVYQKNINDKAEQHYKLNYSLCQGIVSHMLDFATKLAHYRELTQKFVKKKKKIFFLSLTPSIFYIGLFLQKWFGTGKSCSLMGGH